MTMERKKVKETVKEKTKAFTPNALRVNKFREVGEEVKAFFENRWMRARAIAREAKAKTVNPDSASGRG